MNVFELFATLSLDASKYEQGLDAAEKKGEEVADGMSRAGGKWGKVAGVMGTVGKATLAGFTAAATGVSVLTKQSVDAYGQYQQLTGGIQTLFGDASDQMMGYAENAFQTAGLSANQYMEVAIQGSAAMLKSLEGTENAQQRAAELTNLSITDMSDNVNKMGTSMEAVQNAYRGFSRQNWTMLDNLALGYSGTKKGMEELLADAEALSGVHYDIGNYADVVEAIHVIQQNMGITGTTAEEAAGTLTGSMSALTASWQNLITGFANGDADLGKLINDVIVQAQGAIGNMMPIITQAVSGIGQFIGQIAPVLAEQIPTLVTNVLPPLLEAASSIVVGLVQALPSILSILTTVLPTLLTSVIPSILEALPAIVQAGVEVVIALANGISESLPTLIPAIVECILQITTILTDPTNINSLVLAAVTLFGAILQGLIKATPAILEQLPVIIDNIITSIQTLFPLLVTAVMQLLLGLIGAILDTVAEAIGLDGEVVDIIHRGIDKATEIIQTGFNGIQNFFIEVWDNIKKAVDLVWTGIKTTILAGLDAISEFFANWATSSAETVVNVWESIKSAFSEGIDAAKTAVSNGLDAVVGFFSDKFEAAKKIVTEAIAAIRGAFDFEWSLPDLKLPHISVKGGEAPYGIGGKGALPSFDIQWYRKAYDDAYIMKDPTIFGMSGGKFLGGGDGTGSEAIVGTNLLMDMMRGVMSEFSQPVVVQVYIGEDKIDEFVVNSQQRANFRSGGR